MSDADLRALAERYAEQFHDTYERLAPQFDYRTREESMLPWLDVQEPLRSLMIATVEEVLGSLLSEKEAAEADLRLNAALLARQTDCAREAETRAMAVERHLGELLQWRNEESLRNAGMIQRIDEWSTRAQNAEAVLVRLTEAADLYRADQSAAPDPRCGLVQPVTVAQAEALNVALDAAWALLKAVGK